MKAMTASTFQQCQEAEQRAGIERRNQERQNRWHNYLLYVQDARRHMPGHPDEIMWFHLRNCRKALEAALESLGQIETVMERPNPGGVAVTETVAKSGPFLSDVAQTYLEIETHPNLQEVWIRVLSENGNKTFRCSPERAMEIAVQLQSAVDGAFYEWIGDDAS